jgi:hypothetical protein
MEKEDLILLHIQKMDATLSENQLAKQKRDNLRNLQYNESSYQMQYSSIIYLFLGALLGLSFTIRSFLLAIDTVLFTMIFMIYQRRKYSERKRDFLNLHKKIEKYENIAIASVDNLSNKIIQDKTLNN